MRITLLAVCVMVILLFTSGGVGAVSYVSDFESDTIGTLPASWYTAPWWSTGTITAGVAAAPGGGQAVKIVWGTDWASYPDNEKHSSGEAGVTLDMTGIDGNSAVMHVSYDFYKQNYRVWQMFADQTEDHPGEVHMNDDPTKPNEMSVGSAYDNPAYHLYDIPENAWVHVDSTYNSLTREWETSVSYTGGSGGNSFTGVHPRASAIAGEYWWGGWAFKSTMDAEPNGGVYDNALYIDNLEMEVTPVPEPSSLIALMGGLSPLVILRRRRS